MPGKCRCSRVRRGRGRAWRSRGRRRGARYAWSSARWSLEEARSIRFPSFRRPSSRLNNAEQMRTRRGCSVARTASRGVPKVAPTGRSGRRVPNRATCAAQHSRHVRAVNAALAEPDEGATQRQANAGPRTRTDPNTQTSDDGRNWPSTHNAVRLVWLRGVSALFGPSEREAMENAGAACGLRWTNNVAAKTSAMRPRAVLLALGLAATLLLGSVLHVDAVIRNGYNCNPTACKLPSCLCASDSPPLPVADTPQFVTITFDDGISEFHNAEARQFLYASRNPNGCPIAATHFLSRQWTDFHTVNALYDQGHEIADHTVDHLGTPSLEQITVARDIYERWGRVPKKDIVGFRAPFLAYSLDTFRNLQTAGGFVYDSSMSTNGRNPHWPYTMDYGLADECFTGVCDNLDTRFPGLWEIPMYQLHYPADGSILGLMDPQFAGTEEILDMFKYNFRNHWQTSRAPFGIYLHTAWILNDPTNRLSILTRFFEWTQTEFPSNSVWWVSNQQLLSWLRSPVPISTLASSPPSYLSCGAAEVGPGMRLRTMQMDRDYSPCPKDRLQTCMFPDYSWKYCLAPGEKGCPSSQPSVVDPIPAGVTTGGNSSSPSSGGCAMPGDGCAFGRWQQASCACACAGSENATADASGRQGYCLDEGGRCTLEKVVDPRNNRFLSCAESAKARGDEHYFDGAKTTAASSTTATTASSTAAAPTSTGLPPPTSAPASSSSVPVAAIVAPIVILVALGGAGVAFFLLRRSRRSKVAKVGVEPPASGDTEKAVVMRTTDIERTASGLSPADMVRRSSSAL